MAAAGLHPAPPRIEWPEEPSALALWLVEDAAPAKPWMPTVAEQDGRWWEVYGEEVEHRAAAHHHARALIGGR